MTLPPIDETHDPNLRSWVAGANGHPEFPIQNLPLGIFSPPRGSPRAGIAIGDQILDLASISTLLPDGLTATLGEGRLNALFGLPADGIDGESLDRLLVEGEDDLRAAWRELMALGEARLCLPRASST